MVEFRRIQMLFLILVLQFSADITGQDSSFTVRDGDEVTLSCQNVMTDQDKCNSTTWLFSASRNTTVELIKLGQIGEKAKAKSDRLSVTENCSLVIKKVTVEDAGRYTCRQFKSGQQQGPDSQVDLSVVTMTEYKNNNEVTLSCSVLKHGQCRHTVKWVYQGKDVDKENKDLKTSQSTCSVTVSFLTSHFICTSNHELLKCEVTNPNNGKVQLYNISPQLSCEKPGVAETTTEPETTSTPQEDADAITATTATKDATITPQDCSALSYIMLVMHVAELLLITVITVLLFRARGNQRPPDDNIDLYFLVQQPVRSRMMKMMVR
ncbi:uncharacterized protein LOC121882141 isoform X2 [Thunnus maccoyii]|uniref:uncharacterized protein LOC121882141 isoform X2 n=1 Tax=Thunnus maccoyii TaxID=8240 RepID=UPI001C4C6D44|nr:uncharacterized protein LOC121882141 isoform X2 [Thunnus maccoyii]